MDKCYFCLNAGGQILYHCDLYRIILVADEDYPGYLRIITNDHIKELSDLSNSNSIKLYEAVIHCEQIIRQIFNPDKVNIASLGNVTPHLHWHIIPRFKDDRHFPNPIWGAVVNPNTTAVIDANKLSQLIAAFDNFSVD